MSVFALRVLVIVGLGAAALLGCGDPPASKYPSQAIYNEDTTLDAGDLFEVRVFRHEDMSGTFSASQEGTISFPYIGQVTVVGKTPAQIEEDIRGRLADGYLVNPSIAVYVKEYRSKKVSVLGEVRKPSAILFTPGMTVVEAVSQAGGFTAGARENAVQVTRTVDGKSETFTVPVQAVAENKAPVFYMRPGDSVFVPRRRF
ncbi:MAG: polysaccharide export protein [Myxococcales bacterium]|nr:polysaccharide export protein [Myxococcales bacterium]